MIKMRAKIYTGDNFYIVSCRLKNLFVEFENYNEAYDFAVAHWEKHQLPIELYKASKINSWFKYSDEK